MRCKTKVFSNGRTPVAQTSGQLGERPAGELWQLRSTVGTDDPMVYLTLGSGHYLCSFKGDIELKTTNTDSSRVVPLPEGSQVVFEFTQQKKD